MTEVAVRPARILIVEDSDVQALELRMVLEEHGHQVQRAASAEEAMDLLNHDMPDLIVADYQLPRMNGSELTRQLRLNERTRAIPVLMMTSNAQMGERAGLESGADAYVEKSRDRQTLLLRVRALLRGRRQDASGSGSQFRRAHVLIMDSSATGRLHMQSILASEGYLVSMAADVDAATATLEAEAIDCVVVNLLDARFDGVEASRRLAGLRNDRPSLSGARQPFLIVGVGEGKSSGDGMLKAAFLAGVDEVITSAADTEMLRLRLRALVRRQLMADEARRLESERAMARAALEQFRMLVEGVTDYALYMLDPDGNVSTWNAGAQRIKGYEADEIIGQHVSRFYVNGDSARDETAKALAIARREGRYETEAIRVRKDGTQFWAHVVIDPIFDEGGVLRGYAKITRDITERRIAAEELQQARSALMQAQKMEAIGQLTGGIAHDFNNMLAGIIGALNLVRRRIAAQRYDEAEKFIEAAQQSANRAASLTSRLLAFGRRQTLDIQSIDINAAVTSMRMLLDRTMGENVRIETRFDSDELWAATDVGQLESAILNLAINARDAMPDGGELTIETRDIPAGTDVPQALVAVTVRDTGSGMTPDVLAKVFDPFFTTKPVGKGTGLGLSMVYGFVTQSGGEVKIDSEPGRGTSVTLLLPRGDPDKAVAAQPAADATDHQGSGEVVLVVEDDPQVRMLILEVLRDLKYNAVEASTPEDALVALKDRKRIDLMVSDVGLPGMTGRQLAEIARQHRPDLKVLFITGYAAQASVRHEFLGAGMDMLLKPFALDDLAMKIREMMPAAGPASRA